VNSSGKTPDRDTTSRRALNWDGIEFLDRTQRMICGTRTCACSVFFIFLILTFPAVDEMMERTSLLDVTDETILSNVGTKSEWWAKDVEKSSRATNTAKKARVTSKNCESINRDNIRSDDILLPGRHRLHQLAVKPPKLDQGHQKLSPSEQTHCRTAW
jgi:hypothetical protein